LGGEGGDNTWWHGDSVWQEGSKKAYGTKLERYPKLVVVTTMFGDKLLISIIQVEIAGKLRWGWVTNVAAIALFLLRRQKIYWHRTVLHMRDRW
jgi:hypothetical protein